ncbi:hypothetical protein JCM1393_25220 [Clostridium carnis]
MIDKAIEKISDEIEKEKNAYVKVIGQYLLGIINNNEDAAEKILDKDKTIMKSLEAMRKEAEKVKVGNMAMISVGDLKREGDDVIKFTSFEELLRGWDSKAPQIIACKEY